jgi:hypothetical protein
VFGLNQTKIFFLITLILLLGFSYAITTSNASYSSGVYNGDFELGDGSVASSSSVIGDITYGWWAWDKAGTDWNWSYTDINCYTNKCLKLIITNVNSRSYVSNSAEDPPLTLTKTMQKQGIKIKPNTKYKISMWIKSVNAVDREEANFATYPNIIGGARTSINLTSIDVDGNTDWVYRSQLITTNSSAELFYLNIGRISDLPDNNYSEYWFDDVRLEEVGSTSLVGQVSGRPSIVVTGVSDFNAVDQANVGSGTTTNATGFGKTDQLYYSQSFTPTQLNNSGLVLHLRKVGNPLDNVIITIEKESSDIPDGNIIATTSINSSQLTTSGTDYTFYFPFVLTDLNKIVIKVGRSGDLNNVDFYYIHRDTNSTYSNGVGKYYNGTTWNNLTDIYFKTLFEKQSSAFDLNVCSSGDTVCNSKSYDIDFLDNDEVFGIGPADAPLFYLGDNNVYFMMHSDSDFNNKTPSMMASLSYTFDKPTTSLSRTKGSTDNTEIITLTCTSGITGNCNTTKWSLNGITYNNYSTPIVLSNGTYNLRYYSLADNNNTESINTTSLNIPTQGSVATCSIMNFLPILLILIIINLLIGGVQFKKSIEQGDASPMVTYILATIIGIIIIIQFLPILC